MQTMNKSELNQFPNYFNNYLKHVEQENLSIAFTKNDLSLWDAEYDKMQKLGQKVYAEGKWTVNDILQHLIDTERIFAYRALRFARKDKSNLAGFDENVYAHNSNANARSLEDLMEEFKIVRKSSELLFRSFDNEMLKAIGTANETEVSVAAIGFALIGHAAHHLKILKERYFVLL